ncbi:hypothetical protein AAC387_Pa11g0662 [Persea americana]
MMQRREGEEKGARANREDISTKCGKGKRERTSPDKEEGEESESLWGFYRREDQVGPTPNTVTRGTFGLRYLSDRRRRRDLLAFIAGPEEDKRAGHWHLAIA